jgi:hypothetical protein
MRRLIFIECVATFVFFVLMPQPLIGAAENLRDRHAFAEAMAKVKEGMPEAEVKALLGAPDDLRTEEDPGGLGEWIGTKEVWRYGTEGHLTCATLGVVYIDEHGMARRATGRSGDPPPRGMFEEAHLRKLLQVIHQSPLPGGDNLNPRKLIVAVNTLRPLGKEKALAALAEYVRVAEWFGITLDSQRAFLVLRMLFDIPEDPGYMPEMRIGGPSGGMTQDLKELPRFPLAVVDDVPFMLVSGYNLAGFPEPVESHLDYFRENGRLRAKPLQPPDGPQDLYNPLLKVSDPLWRGERFRQFQHVFLASQLLSLIENVYRLPADQDELESPMTPEKFETTWNAAQADLHKLDVRWDAPTNRYVFAKDGSALPEQKTSLYRRKIWRPLQKYEAIVERKNDRRALVSFSPDSHELPRAATLLLYVWDPAKPLEVKLAAEFPWKTPTRALELTRHELRFNVEVTYSSIIALPEGWRARLEFLAGDTKKQTEPWTP